MRKSGTARGILAVAVTALLASGALAQAPRGFADRPFAKWLRSTVERMRTLKSELDLKPQQKMQIGAVLKERRDEILDVLTSLKDKRRVLGALTRANTVDETAIRAAARDMAESIGDAAVLKAEIHREIWPIFTADQKRTAQECREDIEESVDRLFEEMAR